MKDSKTMAQNASYHMSRKTSRGMEMMGKKASDFNHYLRNMSLKVRRRR
jgi:hypothetical protein